MLKHIYMTLSFKTVNNYRRCMPEMGITTHSKIKRFTDMDSSKWYEKKKKNVWGCSPYHSKNRSLLDMLSILFLQKPNMRDSVVWQGVRVNCYHTIWKPPNICYHWSETESLNKGLFTGFIILCFNFWFWFSNISFNEQDELEEIS